MEWEGLRMTPEEEAETKQIMQSMGSVIAKMFPRMGFCLMIFEINKPGQLNYIANCERKDMVEAMEEFIIKTKDSWDRDRVEGTFGIGGKHDEHPG
jgi:hypothetical protein